jgi:ABC-type uncharacterized transport system permease subunit
MPAHDQPADGAADSGGRLTGALRSFGAFWLDFLVGDTPELLIGVLIVIGAAAILVHQHAPSALVIGVIPVLATVLLFFSVAHKARARR